MSILTGCGIVLCLYLLALKPRIIRRPNCKRFMKVMYAHRGLHDNTGDAPENSMLAFKKAVKQGYGMEMDVQLTKDRIPVVFHDENLKRACNVEGNVRDYTYQELQQFTLFQSKQRIPLFTDFLKMVDGKVPLIIEVKIHENPKEVCEIVDAALQDYRGPYCVESFHPYVVCWYRRNRPRILRGQLSTNFNQPGERESFPKFLVHYLLLNFGGSPDFVAYDHRHKNNISRLICKYFYGSLNVAWTVKSQEELDACRKDFEMFIFEGFIPDEKR